MRRHAKALSAALGLSILIGALFASSALAVEIHSFSSVFGTAGSGPGQFAGNNGIAIDQSDGSVYVADSSNYRVQKFDAAGNFVMAFGKGVNKTTSGDVCTAASGNTCGAGTQGSSGSGFDTNNGFSNPTFLAIDPTNGDVYVADSGTKVVDKFSSAGTFLSANDGSGSNTVFGQLAGIAVDPARNLWVYDENAQMREFDSAGAFVIQWNSGYGVRKAGIAVDSATNLYIVRGSPYVERLSSTGADLGEVDTSEEAVSLAIDPATDDLYVGEASSQVKRFAGGCSTPCSALESFGSENIASAIGVAVRGANAKVYVSDRGNAAVETFNLVVLPGVSDEPASAVTGTKATLSGTVNPDNVAVSDCKFEYGTTTAYGSSKPCEGAIPPDANDHPVAAALTGLTPASTYHFRLVATNANGTNRTGDQTFTTNQPAITGAATEVKGTKATLNGIVKPEGETVSECFFEYGFGLGYGKTTPCVGAIPTDEGEHAVTAVLVHLTPHSRYHFRLVINRGHGAVHGADSKFFTEATVITGAVASAIVPPTASVEGTVNPEGTSFTECKFEYGRIGFLAFSRNITTPYEATAPCTESPATIGAGTSPVTVHANLAGLTFGALYHYRLVSTNPDGVSSGADQGFQAPGATIEAEHTLSAGFNEATVGATINPKGSATTYHVEYGTDTSYGTSTPETPLGAEGADQPVSDTLTGLAPATTYHWRVVATSSVGVSEGPDRTFTTFALPPAPETDCPNQLFRSGPSANLSDCRAYEQATPANKHGANIQGDVNVVQASRSGNRITFADAGGLASSGGTSSPTIYLASRGAGSWGFNGLLPLTEPGQQSLLVGWDQELATSAGNAESARGAGIYLRDTPAGTSQLVFSAPHLGGVSLAGFADDTSHLIFESGAALAPGAVANRENLYDLNHGVLALAGRIPAAPATSCDDSAGPACVPAPEGSFAGSYDTHDFGTVRGGVSNNYYTENTISDDGSKVFFTTAGSAQIYLREDGTKTIQVSASQASLPDPNGHKPASFVGATPSGSKAFFTSCEKLTDDSTAVSNGVASCTQAAPGEDQYAEEGNDLYSYDTVSGELTDLTVDSNPADPQHAGVQGFLGASADGSDVYFVANGVLAPGASPGTCYFNHAVAVGACNLYLSHAGTITFIATLKESGDSVNWLPQFLTGSRTHKESRIAADGTLLFSSTRSLTGYDNNLPGPKAECNGLPLGCPLFYRYAPVDDELNCVSCNPSGAAPVGVATLESHQNRTAFGASAQTNVLTRNISADGKRIFFDSPDALLPTDTNGVTDPYEWEAVGSGRCKSATANGGCLYLLSTGTNPEPSYLGDVSESGDDAFIFTDQQLVPADQDELVDVYDASVGGGLASQHQGEAGPACLGEACRGASSSAPNDSTAGSASFSGPGNQAKKPVKRCKKQSQKKCKKSKKSKKHKSKSKKSRAANTNRGGSK